MAENTLTNPGSGGDTIATDELTTLNGAGSAGVKVQRVKVGFGDDGDCRDASSAFPLPTKLMAGDTAGAVVVGTVLQAPLTKGTQGANGVSTQDLKDAGRVIVNASTAIAGVALVNAEALLALDISRGGVATGSATSHTVTAGKRWRVTGIMVGIVATGAAVVSARVSLRWNPVGAVTVTSPIIVTVPLSSAPALAQQGNEMFVPLPDGPEFSGTNQIGLTQVASVAGGNVWASLVGFEY